VEGLVVAGQMASLERQERLGRVIRAEMVALIPLRFVAAAVVGQVLLVALLHPVFLEMVVRGLQTQLLELLGCLQTLLAAVVDIPQLQALLALVVLRLGATAGRLILLELMQS
jgi:hypothetical protein